MKKADVKIGNTYAAKVSGKIVPVRIVTTLMDGRQGWLGHNLTTGNDVRIKSAARLRFEMYPGYDRAGRPVWVSVPDKEALS